MATCCVGIDPTNLEAILNNLVGLEDLSKATMAHARPPTSREIQGALSLNLDGLKKKEVPVFLRTCDETFRWTALLLQEVLQT